MEFITDNNHIRHINTSEVKLSESEIQKCSTLFRVLFYLETF